MKETTAKKLSLAISWILSLSIVLGMFSPLAAFAAEGKKDAEMKALTNQSDVWDTSQDEGENNPLEEPKDNPTEETTEEPLEEPKDNPTEETTEEPLEEPEDNLTEETTEEPAPLSPQHILLGQDVWNANNNQTEITSPLVLHDYFTLRAGTAKDKENLSVDGNKKHTADAPFGESVEFSHRIKMNGKGAQDKRAIAFTTQDQATVAVYAMSGSSSDNDRKVALYQDDGGILGQRVLPVSGNKLSPLQFSIPAAGTYYLISQGSGINIYGVFVEEGAQYPPRQDWSTVTPPAITSAEVITQGEHSIVEVAWDADIGWDGGDYVELSLIDDQGESVDLVRETLHKSSGTVTLNPTGSGNHTVTIALYRIEEGQPLQGASTPVGDFELPLETPEIQSVLTYSVQGNTATAKVSWNMVPEAQRYELSYQKDTETPTVVTTQDTSVEVSGLEIGQTYEFILTAFRDEDVSASAPYSALISAQINRWSSTVNGGGQGGSILEKDDGSLVIQGLKNNGKIADSEDSFLYYYTEVNPDTENFTLTATFTIDSTGSGNATSDNQTGFGIMAVDTFVPKEDASRYFNSAGTMFAKFSNTVDGVQRTAYGIPGGKFVTGYTGSPTSSSPHRDMSASQPFDWDFKADYDETTYKFQAGETYTLRLRKSNTGFHSSMLLPDGTQSKEVIWYEPHGLLVQDDSKYYVGLFAARRIQVTVKDIEFTTIHPEDDDIAQERPVDYITPVISWDTGDTSATSAYTAGFHGNVNGTLFLTDENGNAITEPLAVTQGQRLSVPLTLTQGSNRFTAVFTPSPKEQQILEEHQDLSSYLPISLEFSVEKSSYGQPGEALYVSPKGTAQGDGTKANPLDIHTAVAFAQPGQQIVLTQGVYRPTKSIVIHRGHNGTAQQPITLRSAPGAKVTFDLSLSNTGGFLVRGDHWHFYGFDITNSQGYKKPLHVQGNYNTMERLTVYGNGDTGVQISGSSQEDPSLWPAHNLVLSCESYDNMDPTGNDADGFAAKLTVGEGNVFRYSIAHHNIDDGWDLYAKSTTGSIGAVTIESCVAYENGYLSTDPDRTFVGEGNGIKLGGESVPGAHVLKNSIAFNNYAKGITSNSGPDVKVYDVTSYYNGGQNFQIRTNANTTDYHASGVISYRGGKSDEIFLKQQEDTITTDPSNYFDGRNVTEDWFASLDMTEYPTIAKDGSIAMPQLLALTTQAPEHAGARLGPNPDYQPLELLPEVSVTPEPSPEEPEETPDKTPTSPAKTPEEKAPYTGPNALDIPRPAARGFAPQSLEITKTQRGGIPTLTVTSVALADSPVLTQELVKKALETALQAASNDTQQLILQGYGYQTVTSQGLDYAHALAKQHNLSVLFRMDQLQGRTVTHRVSLVPAASNQTLTVTPQGSSTKKLQTLFDTYFTNPIVALEFAQPSQTPLTLAVKLPQALQGATAAELTLYSYNSASNTYTLREETIVIDRYGYAHFTAPLGAFVLSQGPLTPAA